MKPQRTFFILILELVGVAVHYSSCAQEHFDADDDQNGCHGYDAGKGRVAFAKEPWEAGVGEGEEGCGDEVDEGCCDEDACAEVL